jgi:DNA-binding NarL/FixJ family response regulator
MIPFARPHGSIPANPPPNSCNIRTLLVDDSPIMLETLPRILAKERGFEVTGTATDGRAALLSAAASAPKPVLMDLPLPHLDRAQTTRCLNQYESIPVVFIVSSEQSHASRAMCAAAGADAFIVKSGDFPTQLKSKLHEWFGSKAAHLRISP